MRVADKVNFPGRKPGSCHVPAGFRYHRPSSLPHCRKMVVLAALALLLVPCLAAWPGQGTEERKYEVIETVAPDGFRSPAVLEFPKGPGPFPGVVAVHWGMGGQTAEIIQKMVNTGRAPSRELVRQGYAVLTCDYRHASHIDKEVDDTIAAYEFLRNHPRVIKDRVALCGTSHGAVCSIYAGMRVQPACIVAEEGATDLAYRYEKVYELVRAHEGPLKGNLKLDRELWDELATRLGGTPSEVPDAYRKASAHARANEIRSPILIVAGDGEYLPHALQMYAALLKAKKECGLALFQVKGRN
ncbi:MAG: alpha/beta hydrolase family protein [Acidobacteriota bacterium]